MAQKWPKITQNSPKMTQNCPNWPKNDPKLPKWPKNDPKWPKKLAPNEKNSTDISAASATFCISDCRPGWRRRLVSSWKLKTPSRRTKPGGLVEMFGSRNCLPRVLARPKLTSASCWIVHVIWNKVVVWHKYWITWTCAPEKEGISPEVDQPASKLSLFPHPAWL